MILKALKTIIVGLGRIGWQFHIPSVLNNKGFKLCAVVDPMEERIKEAKEKFGCKGYTDMESALQEEKPDLTVIASPTKFHMQQTIMAFTHGSDVFCDKPMALSVEEAEQMISMMEKYKRKLMVYQPRRICADFISLKELLKENLLGPVYMIKRGAANYERRNDWQAFKKYGGGMLNNYGAHYIDQVLNIAKSRVSKLSCSLRKVASLGDADDVVKAVLEMESGMLIDIDIHQASALPVTSWQIFGKYGAMIWDDHETAWKIRYYSPAELTDVKAQDGLAAANRNYSNGEKIPWKEKTVPAKDAEAIDYYDKCYEYYALDKEPFVDVHETLELMKVLKKCREFDANFLDC